MYDKRDSIIYTEAKEKEKREELVIKGNKEKKNEGGIAILVIHRFG
jgi:hypothetical protein